MTQLENPFPRSGDRSSTLGAGEEYSRGDCGDQNEIRILDRAAGRIRTAPDPAGAIRAVLEALTGPEDLRFANAAWLAVDPTATLLRGEAAVGADRAEAEAEGLRRLCIPLECGNAHPLVRALQDGRPRGLPAAASDEEYGPALAACAGPGPFLALPVAADGTQGLILLDLGVDGDVVEARSAAAEALAGELARALGFLAADEKQRKLSARLQDLGASARSVLGATNLPDVLTGTVRGALRQVGAERGLLWTFDECGDGLKLAALVPTRSDETLDAVMPEVVRRAETCLSRGCAAVCADLAQGAGPAFPDLARPLPAALQPLTAFGDRVGVLAVVGRAAGSPPEFDVGDEAVLATLAGYAAVAIRNAQLAEAWRSSQKRQREMHAELARLEKLANLGEMTTRLAHDLRNPAAAIRGFARRIERGLPKEDARGELARLIAREARRIETRLGDPLEFARQARPRLALRNLNRIVQEAVTDRRGEIQTQGVVLEEAYLEPMPDLLLDSERVRLAVANILQGVLAAARRGDTLRVESLLHGERVMLEIAGTGERPRGESIDRLFAPFGGVGQGGPGLGLAVAHQIVNEHGWEISVRAEGEWGVIFTISIPLQENRERRRSGDRRGGRDRRRGETGESPSGRPDAEEDRT